MKASLAVGVSVTLIGCATFTPPQGHPVLDDRIQEHYLGSAQYVQFATTPERRVVLMNVRASRACAEPTADSAENLSYNLATALAAKDAKSDSVNASISDALQSASKSLFNRTQGVQFFRDGMFSLCLAYMNGAITEANYTAASEDLRNKAAALIAQEIPLIAAITQQKTVSTATGADKTAAPATTVVAPASASPAVPTVPEVPRSELAAPAADSSAAVPSPSVKSKKNANGL